MAESNLNITTQEEKNSNFQSNLSNRKARLVELQATLERKWLLNPEQFNPLRNCMERERLDRSWELLNKHVNLNQFVADIGCAAGVFTRRMQKAGATIDAVDIAENALKQLRKEDMNGITAKQDAMPYTHLTDLAYDLITCMEVIGYLKMEDHRLFFSELARLVKPHGYVLCSTAIDFNTEGAVENFLYLAQTEFNIIELTPSYHALYIRIKEWLKAPGKWVKAWKEPDYRQKELRERKGFNRFWFWFNSSAFIFWFWYLLEPLSERLLNILKENKKVLLFLEKVTRYIWDEDGISNVMILGKKRPLDEPLPTIIERPRKKEIWE